MRNLSMIALIVSALVGVTAPALAKAPASKQVATKFVDTLFNGANGGEYETSTVGITCPLAGGLNPFKGIIMISKPSWEYGEALGALDVRKPAEQPVGKLTSMIANTGEDFDGPVLGMDLQFKQPNGAFYITVLKTGVATVAAGVNGGDMSDPVKCKVVSYEAIR